MAKNTKTEIGTRVVDGFIDDAESHSKVAATMVRDASSGKSIMHLQLEVDFNGLRHKPNGKSAYQYVSVWVEGMRGVRFAGNLFINTSRLKAQTIAKAQENYRKAQAKAQDGRSAVMEDADDEIG